jgi:hypothetical protein
LSLFSNIYIYIYFSLFYIQLSFRQII